MTCLVYRPAYPTALVYRYLRFAIHQLFCGSQNSHNAFCGSFSKLQYPQSPEPRRLKKLNRIAIEQMKIVTSGHSHRLLGEGGKA